MADRAQRDGTFRDAGGIVENYERLSLTLKAMGAGLWDYDITADRLYCNPRWYEILGLEAQADLITSIDAFRSHIHPDDVDYATRIDFREVDDLIASDERYHVEYRIVRPDGDIRWVHSVACLLRDNSNHLRAVGSIIDITEFQQSRTTEEPERTPMPATKAKQGVRLPPRGSLDMQSDVRLSERERECLLWVSVGKTAWETAAILGRSQRTVEFHLTNAIRKLNAANKVHAAAIAIRNGIL